MVVRHILYFNLIIMTLFSSLEKSGESPEKGINNSWAIELVKKVAE